MNSANHDTLVYRLAQMLVKLNQGESLSPQELADEFGVNLRTVQRDLNVRFAYLPLEKHEGRYRLDPAFLGKLSTKDIDRFAGLAGIGGLFPSLSDEFLRDIFDTRMQSALLVKGHNYENLGGKEQLFRDLEKAIIARKQISFGYEKADGQRKSYSGIAPYKLINNKGIWYLAAVDADKLKAFVGFPYTKLMTASAFVDQSAAFIVVSEARADELGIPQDKRVYLHGEAHAHDTWFVSDRERLDQSPAMRLTSRAALAQAGKTIADVDVFDIYSCFPSLVQIACKELGISPDDKRGLTVTGGLPYFGGPGNNYVTHAIAEMVQRVRAKPGAYGLVMANVGLVTKESVGLFSTERPNKPFMRADSDAIQREIDAQTKVRFTEAPQGDATIETYAVLHGKNGPESGVLLGRLAATGERFVANTPADAATLAKLEQVEGIGLPGTVTQVDGRNVFTPRFG